MWRQHHKVIKSFVESMRILSGQGIMQRVRTSNKRLQQWLRWHTEQYCITKTTSNAMVRSQVRGHFGRKPLTICLAACAFKCQDHNVTDDDIEAQVTELLNVQKVLQMPEGNYTGNIPSHWEEMVCEKELKMWKCPKDENLDLLEYKLYGTFSDISARMFFNIQLNNEYRKHWDDLVIKLDVVEENRPKNEQVIQWITRFPYPFSHREYIFVRRAVINEQDKVMVISSKAITHPSCPTNAKYVRVSCYTSHMVIKPHKSFDDLGFDYLMTYCDDPQITLPSGLSSWVLSQGIPEYIRKVHDACLNFGSVPSTPNIANYSL